MLELGFSSDSIQHRLARRRLHPVHRGVYAVGRPELTQHGRWRAAVLACGPTAVLSHASAAALWGICPVPPGRVEVSFVADSPRRVAGIALHRRSPLSDENVTRHRAIPVTSPICTLIDLAAMAARGELESAVNESDRLDLVDPESLRRALDETPPRRGVGLLRELLDRRTFTFTRSQLERRFLPIARAAGLPKPETCTWVNGFEVDFYWSELNLVVETDGLRYHRTAAQQNRDRVRDQTHTAAGLTPLRFTHEQVRFDPEHVRRTLAATARRLA